MRPKRLLSLVFEDVEEAGNQDRRACGFLLRNQIDIIRIIEGVGLLEAVIVNMDGYLIATIIQVIFAQLLDELHALFIEFLASNW